MAFEKGVSGNPGGKPKQKPFRDALAMEAALAENGEETPAKKGSLRWIARQLLVRAGDCTAAAREVADRLDGKPTQALEHSGGIALSHEQALRELDDSDGEEDTTSAEG